MWNTSGVKPCLSVKLLKKGEEIASTVKDLKLSKTEGGCYDVTFVWIREDRTHFSPLILHAKYTLNSGDSIENELMVQESCTKKKRVESTSQDEEHRPSKRMKKSATVLPKDENCAEKGVSFYVCASIGNLRQKMPQSHFLRYLLVPDYTRKAQEHVWAGWKRYR